MRTNTRHIPRKQPNIRRIDQNLLLLPKEERQCIQASALAYTHRLSISPVRYIFFLLIIRNIYTFLLLPPISNTYTLVHFFFVKTAEHRTVNKRTSSFSFIQLVDENGWKNVFSAVCKCSKVSYSQFSRVYAV